MTLAQGVEDILRNLDEKHIGVDEARALMYELLLKRGVDIDGEEGCD